MKKLEFRELNTAQGDTARTWYDWNLIQSLCRTKPQPLTQHRLPPSHRVPVLFSESSFYTLWTHTLTVLSLHLWWFVLLLPCTRCGMLSTTYPGLQSSDTGEVWNLIEFSVGRRVSQRCQSNRWLVSGRCPFQWGPWKVPPMPLTAWTGQNWTLSLTRLD